MNSNPQGHAADALSAQDQRECVMACERLCHDFAWYVDHRNHAEFVALFAPDGSFIRGDQVSRGHAQVLAFLEGRPTDVQIRHLSTNIRVTPLSQDKAAGDSYVLFFRTTVSADQPMPWPCPPAGVAEYHDEFVRTPLGWRFLSRSVQFVFA